MDFIGGLIHVRHSHPHVFLKLASYAMDAVFIFSARIYSLGLFFRIKQICFSRGIYGNNIHRGMRREGRKDVEAPLRQKVH